MVVRVAATPDVKGGMKPHEMEAYMLPMSFYF